MGFTPSIVVPLPEPRISACEVTRLIDIQTLVTASPRILVLLWGVTLPYCAFTGWLFVYLAEQNAPFPADVLAGLFLLMGVLMLTGTVTVTLRYLRYDAVRLAEVARQANVQATLELAPEVPHVWHWFWPRLDLARNSNDAIGRFLQPLLAI